MKIAALSLPLLIAGCAATPPPAAPSQQAECSAEGLGSFVGQTASSETGAQMMQISHARTLRWVAPGMAVTMDYRADRLTVSYDKDMRIDRASCG